MARALEEREPSLRHHADRVAGLAEQLALRLGWPHRRARQLFEAGLMHDVGKIGIADAVLRHPGPLSDRARAAIERHPVIGARIAAEVLSAEQASWIRTHHERWDGRGYPDRLAGDAIPDGGQILALADAFDAMTTHRCYQPARTRPDALRECSRCRGCQFAPAVVDALLVLHYGQRSGVASSRR